MATPALPPLDLNNVQGDIITGLPKKTETYSFFQIDNARVSQFRRQLAHFIPLITTTAQALSDRTDIDKSKKSAAHRNIQAPRLTISGVNIAFTQKGLVKLGLNDDIGDASFKDGMLAHAKALGDNGTTTGDDFSPDWNPAFKQDIHGLILVSGDCHATVAKKLSEIHHIFHAHSHQASIHETIRIVGDVRPGKESAHEHFGFLDGISQPAVDGVDKTPLPGQDSIAQGIFLLGRDGDPTARPEWARDGSFLAFRYLFQLVPEFNRFLEENPIPGLPPKEGSELLGARLVGRWKSGAPIDITPLQDDPYLGADPNRNNDFDFNFPGDQQTQERCPFAAHVRKTYPRADLEEAHPPSSGPINIDNRRILRHGIQFGPEVSHDEAKSGKTTHGRGLLFVAYQSDIAKGFEFIQQSWANEVTFPPFKTNVKESGFDPIIGQDPAKPDSRTLVGTDPKSEATSLTLDAHWVVPKGGEYFFTPSISALENTFAIKQSGAAKEEL